MALTIHNGCHKAQLQHIVEGLVWSIPGLPADKLKNFFAPVVLGNFRAQWESLPAQPTPATLPTPLECSCSLGDVELDPRQRHHQAELVGCRGPWLRNRTEEGHCWGCGTDTWAEGNQMEQGSLSHGDHEKTTGISIGHGKWIQAMLVSCKPTLETQND